MATLPAISASATLPCPLALLIWLGWAPAWRRSGGGAKSGGAPNNLAHLDEMRRANLAMIATLNVLFDRLRTSLEQEPLP
jgi:hypothetical protein